MNDIDCFPSRVLRQLLLSSLLLPCLQISLISAVSAVPVQVEAPPQLQTWAQWMKPHLRDLDCAARGDRRLCDWASKVHIQLTQNGAHLSYEITMDRADIVPLLGGDQVAIQKLEARQGDVVTPSPVVWRDQRAWVNLPPGPSHVEVSITWSQTPDFLFIPPHIAQVTLTEGNESRSWVERDTRGAVWLKTRNRSKPDVKDQPNAKRTDQDQVHVQIFRVWRDDIPLRLETLIQLNVSGAPRELTIKNISFEGATPVKLDTNLSADWVHDGLRLYLKPGQAEVKLSSVFPRATQTLKVPEVKGGKVAPQEIWVWHSNEQLRSVKLSGLEEIDPDFTSLPDKLKGGTHTWIAPTGGTLTIQEIKRGVQRRPANDLKLTRSLWLDLDGQGMVARDHITGALRASGRLNALSSGVMGRASLGKGASAQPLLITQDPRSGQEGVELRAASLDLYVDGRYPKTRDEIIALDWAEQMNHLSVELNLPPGWMLFAAEGASRCSSAWLNSWHMIEIFFLALITIGFGRLFGFRWGVMTLITLILYHGSAPPSPMIWIALMVSLVLLRVALQAQRFQWLTLSFFVVCALSFASMVIDQSHRDLRRSLHPQLGQRGYSAITQAQEEGYDRFVALGDRARSSSMTGRYKKAAKRQSYRKLDLAQQLQQLDQSAVVQTGPGIPHWSHVKHHLAFDAPIESGRTLQLYLITPVWSRLISATRGISLLILLLMILVSVKRTLSRSTHSLSRSLFKSAASSLLMMSVICFSLEAQADPSKPEVQSQKPISTPTSIGQSADANAPQHAQLNDSSRDLKSPDSTARASNVLRPRQPLGAWIPSQDLLDEWIRRTREARGCRGECIYLGSMSLNITQHEITLRLRVHAERDTFFALPGTLDVIQWSQVKIAQRSVPMRLEASNAGQFVVQARVPQGVHDLIARGRVADLEQLSLSMVDLPHQLELSLKGWREEGARGGQVTPIIKLSRSLTPEHTQTQPAAQSSHKRVSVDFSWYQVSRALTLGPTWQMVTRVERAYTHDEPTEVVIPLLNTERVLSSAHKVTPKGVRLSFPAHVRVLEYLSEIPIQDTLDLIAPEQARWSEVWTLHCGVIWDCQYRGLNPVSLGTAGQPMSPTWRPWPSERVEIKVKRPRGTPGPEATVQHMEYTFSPSATLGRGDIQLTLNASRGGARSLTLPSESKNVNLYVANKQQFDPIKAGKVRLPVRPGKNTYRITWSQPWRRDFFEKIPAVELDLEVVNLSQRLKLGSRWLLWTSGPAWGPAILFWGQLIVAFLLALVLGHRAWSPLSRAGWVLLLGGLTQQGAEMWVLTVGWFAAFELRRHFGGRLKNAALFNLAQLALVGSTLIFLGTLTASVYSNLLQDADMQIRGAESTRNMLRWYTDRVQGPTPSAGIYTLSQWVWRGAMLMWSLWIAYSLLNWLRWAWGCLNQDGGWRTWSILERMPDTFIENRGHEESSPPFTSGDESKTDDPQSSPSHSKSNMDDNLHSTE